MSILAPFRQWLFRLKPDEHLPIVLTQRRIFIVPARSGLLFAAVLCLMLIGAVNYNLSLGHALVFLLAGLASWRWYTPSATWLPCASPPDAPSPFLLARNRPLSHASGKPPAP